jgi:23S rRNA (adenine1618-N6)-methyltransferase
MGKYDAHLLPLEETGLDKVDFVMCNPPFYASDEDMVCSAEKKARPPNSVCTGAPVEMVCEGGEVAFVSRLLDDSLLFRERVQWYTTMFGKLTSLQEFVGKLREKGIDNYAVTEFVQGNKTKRWGLGWSFGSMRPSDEAARGMKGVLWKALLPAVVEVVIGKVDLKNGVRSLEERLSMVLGGLDLLEWEWDKEKLRGVGRASENVWSRAWRRRKMREEKEGIADGGQRVEGGGECRFGFLVCTQVSRTEAIVSLRWLEGHGDGLFESFAGWLKTQIKSLL